MAVPRRVVDMPPAAELRAVKASRAGEASGGGDLSVPSAGKAPPLPKQLMFHRNRPTPLASVDLSLWAHSVNDSALSKVAGWTNTTLTALNLDNSTMWTSKRGGGLQLLLASCPNLMQFSASRSPSVDAAAVGALSECGLRRLRLSECEFSPVALQQLRVCSTLQVLDVQGCPNITYTDVNIVLANCAKLESIHLSGMQHPRTLKQRRALSEGIVSSKTVKDVMLSGLEGLDGHFFDSWVSKSPQMRSLDLSRISTLQDEHFRFWGEVSRVNYVKERHKGMRNLEYLNLAFNPQLGDVAIAFALEHCANIIDLDLSYTGITNAAMEHVGRCPGLTRLRLTGCTKLTDYGVAQALGGVVGAEVHGWVTTMAAEGRRSGVKVTSRAMLARLSSEGAKEPMGMKWLRVLDLTGCTGVTDLTLFALGRHVPWLRGLSLEDCVKVTTTGVKALVSGCSGLYRLVLKNVHDVDLEAFTDLMRTCTNMVALDATNCAGVQDTLGDFVGNLRHLRILNVSGCSDVGRLFTRNLPRSLRVLHARGVFGLNTEALNNVVDQCPHLEELDVSDCRALGLRSFDLITNRRHVRLANLHTLNVRGCMAPDDEAKLLGMFAHQTKKFGCVKVRNLRVEVAPPELPGGASASPLPPSMAAKGAARQLPGVVMGAGAGASGGRPLNRGAFAPPPEWARLEVAPPRDALDISHLLADAHVRPELKVGDVLAFKMGHQEGVDALEPCVSEQFVGVTWDATTRHETFVRAYLAKRSKENRLATKIQTYFRVWSRWNVTNLILQQRRDELNGAITKAQTQWRGYVARTHYPKMRRAMYFINARFHWIVRFAAMKKLLAKATRFRRKALFALAIKGMSAWTIVMAEKRGEEAEFVKNKRATDHFRGKTLRASMQQMKVWYQAACGTRLLLRKAAQHYVKTLTKKCFRAVEGHWATYRDHRLKTCAAFAGIAFPESRNALRMVERAEEAVRRGARKRKWVMLMEMQKMVATRVEWMLLSRRHHIERRTHTDGRKAFNLLDWYKKFQVRMRRKKKEAYELWARLRRKNVLAQLRRLVGVREWFVEATAVARRHRVHHVKKAMWKAWRNRLHHYKAYTKSLLAALSFRRRHFLTRAVYWFHLRVQGKLRAKWAFGTSTTHWRQVCQSKAMSRWKLSLRIEKDALAPALHALTRLQLKISLHIWLGTAHRVTESQWSEFEVFYHRATSSIKMQAWWRGWIARRRALEYITLRTIMAIRIQTGWRTKAGKLALRRLIRMRALKDFMIRERCLEEMAVLDEEARLFERQHKAAAAIQAAFRHHRVRLFFLGAMQAKQRVRRRKWADAQDVVREEYQVAVLEREEEAMDLDAKAIMIQTAWRGRIGRKLYRIALRNLLEYVSAARIQAIYRGRQGRRRAGAMGRLAATAELQLARRQAEGRVLRVLGAKTRGSQFKLRTALDNVQLDLERSITRAAEAMDDIAADFRVWRYGEKKVEEVWKPGDCVRVTYKNSDYYGNTGMIIKMTRAAFFGGQAAIIIDHNSKLVSIPVLYGRNSQGKQKPGFVRVEGRWIKPIPGYLVAPSAKRLQEVAEEWRVILARRKAAKTIQRAYRFYAARTGIGRALDRIFQTNMTAQKRILRRLRALHLDNRAMGWLLVKLGTPKGWIPHLQPFYVVPIVVRRRFQRLILRLRRVKDMVLLFRSRSKWVGDQKFQLAEWQVSGGSRLARAVAAAAAFEFGSGIRERGYAASAAASVAATVHLADLSAAPSAYGSDSDDDESKALLASAAKQDLLALQDAEAALAGPAGALLPGGVAVPALPLPTGSRPATPKRAPRPTSRPPSRPPSAATSRPRSAQVRPASAAASRVVITGRDAQLKLTSRVTGRTTDSAALLGHGKGAATARRAQQLVAVNAKKPSVVPEGMDDFEWRQDMPRYRFREVSDGGRLGHPGFRVVAPDSFSPETNHPLRFRRRSRPRAIAWKAYCGLRRLTTSKLAAWLQRKADAKRAASRLPPRLHPLAATIGGAEWLRTDLERHTWVGQYKFTELDHVPHVDAKGLSMYHGEMQPKLFQDWAQGEGFAAFLCDDKGAEFDKSTYAAKFDQAMAMFAEEVHLDAEDIKARYPGLSRRQEEFEAINGRLPNARELVEMAQWEEAAAAEDRVPAQTIAERIKAMGSDARAEKWFDGEKQQRGALRTAEYKKIATKTREIRLGGKKEWEEYEPPLHPCNGRKWSQLEAKFDYGWITGDITLWLTDGSMYHGPYVHYCPAHQVDPHCLEAGTLSKVHLFNATSCLGHDRNRYAMGRPQQPKLQRTPRHWGKWTSPDGTTYQGVSVDNHFSPEGANGQLVVHYLDGTRYAGTFQSGKRHGYGRAMYVDGSEYDGSWESDMYHGRGTMCMGDGSRVDAVFVSGMPEGYVKEVERDGSRFAGAYVHGMRHGHGFWKRVTRADEYQGEFRFGLPHGLGRRTYRDGSVYKGEWAAGVREGYGVLFMPTGERYDGPWSGDMKHGVGIWTTPYTAAEREDAEWEMANERVALRLMRRRFLGEGELEKQEEEDRLEAAAVEAKKEADAVAAEAARVKAAARAKADPDDDGLSVVAEEVTDDVQAAVDLSLSNYAGVETLEWRQKGYWQKTQHDRLYQLEMLRSRVSTIEFKRRFPLTERSPAMFTSEFALNCAQHLPYLPDGVDEDDLVVRYIVERLIQENGEAAGADGLRRAKEELEGVLPKAKQARGKVHRLEAQREERVRVEARTKAAAGVTGVRVDELRTMYEALHRSLAEYWEKDPAGKRKAYEEAVEKLEKVDRQGWYQARTMVSPFPARIVGSVITMFALLVGEPNVWSTINMWFMNSEANVKAGNKMALVRPYDVRLIDYVTKGGFDVYALARSPARLKAILPFMSHPEINADNVVLHHISTALPAVCGWCRAAFSVAKYAVEMLPKRREVDNLKIQLDAHSRTHERNADAHAAAAQGLQDTVEDLELAREAYEAVLEQVAARRKKLVQARLLVARWNTEAGIDVVHGGTERVGLEFLMGEEAFADEEQVAAYLWEEQEAIRGEEASREDLGEAATELLAAVRQHWEDTTTRAERQVVVHEEVVEGEEEWDADGDDWGSSEGSEEDSEEEEYEDGEEGGGDHDDDYVDYYTGYDNDANYGDETAGYWAADGEWYPYSATWDGDDGYYEDSGDAGAEESKADWGESGAGVGGFDVGEAGGEATSSSGESGSSDEEEESDEGGT